MFGLGSRELRDGAGQLLRGEGDMGQALFSASLGGTPVQQVLRELREQSERLYKPRATVNVSIRPAAHRYKELLRQSREAMVNPETWDTLEKELAEAEAQQRTLEAQIAKLDEELARVERWEAALPMILRLNEATGQLSALPTMPELASDFASRAQAARTALQSEQVKVNNLTERLGKLQNQLTDSPESPAVLNQAEALDYLHEDLGAYRANKAAFDEIKAKIAGVELLLRTGMEKLELTGDFDSLAASRLSTPARLACEAAASALRIAQTEQAKNASKISDLKEQIQDRESELRGLTETNLTQLREALTAAEGAIEADRTYAASQAELKRLTRETAGQHKQLIGAPGDLNATASLPVPALATIRQHKERMDELKREIKSLETKTQDGKARLENIQAELARIQRQRTLPSEKDLLEARRYRDHGWTLVLAEWKGPGKSEELDPNLPLEEAFPKAIKDADEIADVLRDQAEAVAQAEEKRSQIAEAEKQISEAAHKVSELQAALDQCQTAWESEWSGCGLAPRAPAEMIEWREDWCVFKERLAKLRTAQELFEAKEVQIQQAKERLAAALGASEEKEFSLLFQQAKAQVQEAEERRGRRKEISKQLTRWQADLAKLEESHTGLLQSVNTAAEQWRSQCRAVRLPESTSPDAGLTLLRERSELLAKFEQWQELSARLQHASEQIRDYEQGVAKNANALGIGGDSTFALESAMWKALAEARKVQITRTGLVEQIAHVERDLAGTQLRFSESERALKELIDSAQLQYPNELEPFLGRLEQRNKSRAHINELRGHLVGLARNPRVDDFITEVCAHNPDELRDRKSKAEQDKAGTGVTLTSVRETVFGLTARKRDLEKAGDTAASFRQQAESCAAGLREDAARYLRLCLAAHLLETQIKRFREENQGPLLRKSGELFSAITRGAFTSLAADISADDIPILVGLRPDGSKVSVEGLSDGTRDQLYLALRLAALEHHIQEHEPMPLILDDLLITFDNDRAAAILSPLAGLAKRTQIFLFTHHHHLVDLCRQTLGEAQFQLHLLGVAG
jgi:uncharacterized protein YhaN